MSLQSDYYYIIIIIIVQWNHGNKTLSSIRLTISCSIMIVQKLDLVRWIKLCQKTIWDGKDIFNF